MSEINKTGIKLVDRLMLTKHLAVMLKSGITLTEALEVLADQAKNTQIKKVLIHVHGQVKNGVSLEKALGMWPRAFDPLYINIVAVGERSGNLDKNLEYLAVNMAKGYEFRKKVTAAMMYPTIVLGAAGFSGLILATYVLPKMVEMFKTLDVTLPVTTRILVWVADTFQKYGWLIIAGTAGLVIGAGMLLRVPKIKKVWQEWLFLLPGLGKLLGQIEITLICRNIGIMLGSGLPINEALTIATRATDNLVFREYLAKLALAVEQGKSIGREMGNKKYQHIPMIVARMVQVGEKSGKLDEAFNYLAEFFEEEVDDIVKNLGTILEPVMLVIIALVVGFIAFAIISPIYQLTSGIRK